MNENKIKMEEKEKLIAKENTIPKNNLEKIVIHLIYG
jgi:hypothetical protein